jgi:hypothetical protein
MFASKPVEHLPRWLRAPSPHISQASLDALDGLDALQKLLVGFRILDDDLGSPVDRQDQRVAGFLEAVEELRRVSLEVTEGPNIVGNVQHGVLTKFASNLMIASCDDSVNQRVTVLKITSPAAPAWPCRR